jgi:hypothetical protein
MECPIIPVDARACWFLLFSYPRALAPSQKYCWWRGRWVGDLGETRGWPKGMKKGQQLVKETAALARSNGTYRVEWND